MAGRCVPMFGDVEDKCEQLETIDTKAVVCNFVNDRLLQKTEETENET